MQLLKSTNVGTLRAERNYSSKRDVQQIFYKMLLFLVWKPEFEISALLRQKATAFSGVRWTTIGN